MRAYQGACAQVIGRYEGFVAQYLGDGIMAYFGYPQAHEDDAERAVRAGLDLVTAVGRLDTKAKVEVRVGIATGLVVVGDLLGEGGNKERAVTGETPNLAARLQGLAAPGSVVVSAATRRLLGGQFALRDLGPQQIKGLDAPLTVFAVEGVRSFESRFEALAGGLTGFIGREEECQHLLERWKLARQGRGQVVLVSGEAGIGKSRLAAWLVETIASEPHTRLRYQCTPHHKDSALYPTIAQLERAAAIEPNEPAEQKLAKLATLLALAKLEPTDTVPLFAALLGIPTGERYPPLAMSPGQQRQRTMAALLDQVEGLAKQKPLLMVYEDAHWADATSLESLDALVDRVARLPVLLVITGRPEFSPGWAGRHNISTVSLRKLGKRETRAMVESISGGAALSGEVLEQIVQKTDGVPLFIEELTKTVLEAGAAVEGGTPPQGAAAALAIPATLQDSLMARLDRSKSLKEIAQIGAVMGREFSYKLLVAVAGMHEASIREGLSELEQTELATRRGMPPDATYTFKHALVQNAAYESLLKSRRQVIHRRIAKALQELLPMMADTEPEVIAHHFTQAGWREEAVDWWTKAGEVASRRSANVEAIRHFEKAIALAEQLADTSAKRLQRFRLQVAYGNVLIAVHGYSSPRALSAYSRCSQLGANIDDVIERFSGFYGIWIAAYASGHTTQALALIQQFLAEIGPLKDGAEAAIGGRLLGSAQLNSGDYVGAIASLDGVMAHYNSARDGVLAYRFGHDTGTVAMLWSAIAHRATGRVEAARALMDRVIEHSAQISHPQTRAVAHGVKALFELMGNDTKSAGWNVQSVSQISRDYALPAMNSLGTFLQGLIYWRDSEQANGETLMRQARDSGNIPKNLMPIYEAFWAESQAVRDPLAGLSILNMALAVFSKTGQHFFDAELHRLRAKFLRLPTPADDHAAALALHHALEIARGQKARTYELLASLDLARLYCDTGRECESKPLLEGALVGFQPTPELPEIGEAQRLLASLT